MSSEELPRSRAPSLHRHYPASSLPADPSATLSPSAHFPGSPVIGPTQLPAISRRAEEGFSSCLVCPVSPCCRLHPAEVVSRVGQISAAHAAFAPISRAQPSGLSFRGHIRVHFRYGPVTRTFPCGRFVDRLQIIAFAPLCYPSYGALTLAPAGLFPAEQTSLRWTHEIAPCSSASLISLENQAMPVCVPQWLTN